MKAVVVFESMYGNTHLVADAIGEGLRTVGEAVVVSVHDADASLVASADLLVVGGPTHVHGTSRPTSRDAAAAAADQPKSGLTMDPEAQGPGVREWLESLDTIDAPAAAFDTRVDIAPVLSGRASKGIAKALRRHGYSLITEPENFLVTKETHLEPDEAAHARRWGAQLAALVRAPSEAH